MTARHILLDDNNPVHVELPIYRTGKVGTVRLSDSRYAVYSTLEINAHDYAALFHYGVVEELNALPFIAESGNGLDSWDESFLPSASIGALIRIVERCIGRIADEKSVRIVLGWQDDPERIAYWRELRPEAFALFLRKLVDFAAGAESEGLDLEFIL